MKLKLALNKPTYNLEDKLALVAFGDLLRSIPVHKTGLGPVTTDLSELATETSIVLPEDAKASVILRAYARSTSASGTLGELTISAANVTPTAGHIAVAPNGDCVLLATDAYTSVDVVYVPARGFSKTLAAQHVASNSMTLPTSDVYVSLVAAKSDAGTTTGNLKVVAPGATPSTGQCCLNAAKTAVVFASADAVTSADVTLLVSPSVDSDVALEMDVEF